MSLTASSASSSATLSLIHSVPSSTVISSAVSSDSTVEDQKFGARLDSNGNVLRRLEGHSAHAKCYWLANLQNAQPYCTTIMRIPTHQWLWSSCPNAIAYLNCVLPTDTQERIFSFLGGFEAAKKIVLLSKWWYQNQEVRRWIAVARKLHRRKKQRRKEIRKRMGFIETEDGVHLRMALSAVNPHPNQRQRKNEQKRKQAALLAIVAQEEGRSGDREREVEERARAARESAMRTDLQEANARARARDAVRLAVRNTASMMGVTPDRVENRIASTGVLVGRIAMTAMTWKEALEVATAAVKEAVVDAVADSEDRKA